MYHAEGLFRITAFCLSFFHHNPVSFIHEGRLISFEMLIICMVPNESSIEGNGLKLQSESIVNTYISDFKYQCLSNETIKDVYLMSLITFEWSRTIGTSDTNSFVDFIDSLSFKM